MKKSVLLLSISLIFSFYDVYSQDNAVEEVIVTATKTEKTLQEVPVAVSVVTSETIEKATWTLAAIMGFLSLLAAFNFGSGNNEISTEIDKNEGISLPSSNDPINIPSDLPN